MNKEIKDIIYNLKIIAHAISNREDAVKNDVLIEQAKVDNIKLSNDVFDLKLSDFIYNIDKLETTIKSEKMAIKKIKVFVASSGSLNEERKEIEDYLFQKNDTLIDEGIYLQYNVWEKASSGFSPTRIQDEFNKDLVYESDIFICLIKEKVGKFTQEEFDEAYRRFKGGEKPKIMYIFFKELAESEKQEIFDDNTKSQTFQAVRDLKQHIGEIEQMYSQYSNKDDLIRQVENNLSIDLNKL
jgi:hypothetical protein